MDLNKLATMSVKDAFIETQKKFENLANSCVPNSNTLVKDADSSLFLTNSLERIDPVLHKPLSRFYWNTAMPILYGGGALEYASFYRVNYTTYDSGKNVASGNVNVLTSVKATIQKYQTIVKPYAWSIEIGWIDEMKLGQVDSSILEQVDEGVRLYYNQKLDDIAFFGMVGEGETTAYGLANNANVAATNATKTFAESTPTEIVDAINSELASVSNASQYSVLHRVNQILLPPSVLVALNRPMAIDSTSGGIYRNIMEYFRANNFIRSMYGDDDIMVFGVPYLETAGADNSKRIIVYRFDENCLRMPLPMDLTRGATMFDTGAMQYKTAFVCFIGQPQFVYLKTIGYLDKV